MYHNPEKLAAILGIPKLPEFAKKEFKYEPSDILRRSTFERNALLDRINEQMRPPASAYELLGVLELFKLGMHYVQHKTGDGVKRNMAIAPLFVNERNEYEEVACAYQLKPDSYCMTDRFVAELIESSRDHDTEDSRIYVTHHAPRMSFKHGVDILLAGAEEAHHAVTYRKHPQWHEDNDTSRYNNASELAAYYTDKIELAFGDFLPQLVSDFGLEITSIGILRNLDALRGDMPAEEYKQLYRKRLQQKYGFTLPGNDDTHGIEK